MPEFNLCSWWRKARKSGTFGRTLDDSTTDSGTAEDLPVRLRRKKPSKSAFALDEAGFSISHPPSIDEAFLEESEGDSPVTPNFLTELQRVLRQQDIQETLPRTMDFPLCHPEDSTPSKMTATKHRSVPLPQFPITSGETGALSSRLTKLIPQLFLSALDLRMPEDFLDLLEDCASVTGEILGHVVRREFDLAAMSRVVGSLQEKVAAAEQLSIASSENHSVEARIWKKELDRMTSDLSATRKLGREASERLSETQQSLMSLESAISQEKAQKNLLTEQLEQSLTEFRELKNQLERLAPMKEENKRLEMEVLRLNAALREFELMKADQELLTAKLTVENAELKFDKGQTAEELDRTRELAAEASQLYYERLKSVSAGFERQSRQLEQELKSTTDALDSLKSQTQSEIDELKDENKRLKKDLAGVQSNYEKLLIEERQQNYQLASANASFSNTIRSLQGEVRQYRQLLDVAEERTKRSSMVSAIDFAPISQDVPPRDLFAEQINVKQNQETFGDVDGGELSGR
ncbi:hypothetical protein RvY_07492 [Ramazzottius varieornatus]|uniref:Uncharacterized protein n=1 Tax=Ramazzottius varieornatus TaxID=947166 RepID=A0A1D1VBU2_RAMVA|nr:hypothetical protein RvY_07492 [Ramazzottius varieornatus]